ncbi:purine-rich element binding protein A, partial [Columba livia]
EQALLPGRQAERQGPLPQDRRGGGGRQQEPPDPLHVGGRRVPRLPGRLHRALRAAGAQPAPRAGAGGRRAPAGAQERVPGAGEPQVLHGSEGEPARALPPRPPDRQPRSGTGLHAGPDHRPAGPGPDRVPRRPGQAHRRLRGGGGAGRAARGHLLDCGQQALLLRRGLQQVRRVHAGERGEAHLPQLHHRPLQGLGQVRPHLLQVLGRD